jgi:hypothetical protein
MGGHVARLRERRGAYRFLGERPLERTKRRWDDNSKMDIQEVGLVVWIRLIWLMIWTGGGHL